MVVTYDVEAECFVIAIFEMFENETHFEALGKPQKCALYTLAPYSETCYAKHCAYDLFGAASISRGRAFDVFNHSPLNALMSQFVSLS